MQEKLFDLLIDEAEITWKSVILDLVKSEKMDPWDIDITHLGNKYKEHIMDLKNHSFLVSGKIIFASALLLNMKSHIFLNQYIPNFDSQLFPSEDMFEELDDYSEVSYSDKDIQPLLVKTPQARKRKISLNDLMKALEKALDVDTRRNLRRRDEEFIRTAEIPKVNIDITSLIQTIYDRISIFFRKKEEVTFTKLLDSDRKEDKITTFLPLLHLQNQDRINLDQKISFGEIYINPV